MKLLLKSLFIVIIATLTNADKNQPLECTPQVNRMGGFTFCHFGSQTSKSNDVSKIKIIPSMFQGQFLSGNSITAILLSLSEFDHIPSAIFTNFGDVSRLQLASSKITQIDRDDFTSAPHLRFLEIHHSQIGNISAKAFELLKDLEEVKIDHSDIENFSSDAFSGLANLKTIVLSENTYKNGIPKFKNLPSTVKVEY